LQRLLDRLSDVPVMVVDAAAEVLAANSLATALFGDLSGMSRRERNIAWRQFTGAQSRIVRTPTEEAQAEAQTVAELHDALGRYPTDEYLNGLIAELRAVSPRFVDLWEKAPVARAPARRKTFLHPEVGPITLDCDALTVQGSDLRVIVYTAPAGSTDSDSLALLGAVGLQAFPD
jgi:hypothetical protein